ncbi:DUF6973 domain-containing protein [Acinetobacter sp. ANC 4654]|uniref:DUF6973 domain-containing protein n=1 Tax=Acinetobacter sp. ANC 4654 TaxID=1977872 RepID=UPI003A4C7818
MNYSINNTLAFNSIDMSHLNGWQMSFESAASNFISNSSFTFGNKPVGALAYENYQVGSFRENMAHIGNVGPLDAIKAKNIAKESLSNAQNSGLSGVHNGAADAYRHCQWSCEMGKQLGVDQASKIGGTHESYSKGPVNEIYMDTYNNALGRQMSLRPEGCKVNCMKLVEKGVLFQLEIAKPKKR